MKMTVSLDAMPCGLVEAYLRFGGNFCVRVQGTVPWRRIQCFPPKHIGSITLYGTTRSRH